MRNLSQGSIYNSPNHLRVPFLPTIFCGHLFNGLRRFRKELGEHLDQISDVGRNQLDVSGNHETECTFPIPRWNIEQVTGLRLFQCLHRSPLAVA